jgi:ATP-dependent Clp protease ATP-binding subunit ClpC
MFERFTERARGVLADAGNLARELKSPAIRRHHLLIAVLDASNEGSESVAAVLTDAGVDPGELRGTLVESLKASETALPDSGGKVPFTAEAKKALELSLREALSLGHNYIGREHLLLGILRDAEGPLAEALSNTKLTHKRAREIVAEQSPPSRGAARRRLRGGEVRAIFTRRPTIGLQMALRRAFERAGGDRAANTGDLLVGLLETPGTHFEDALKGVSLDAAAITAEVDRLCETNAVDGTEGGIRINEAGGITIDDPKIAAELKRLAGGEGNVSPEQLIRILRRLQD